jgi:hypothetical protein
MSSSFWLRIAAALFAFAAAGFWFASAWDELPPIVPYLGFTPPDDPFTLALAYSVSINRYAAIAAGIAAVLVGVGEITTARRSR